MSDSSNKKKAGVVGYPVSHSLSPKIHNFWFEQQGIKGEYDLLEVTPQEFDVFLRSLHKNGFAGVNITVPYKEKAFEAVDELSEEAKKIGAVNTIIVKDGGTLAGINTDAFGFIENIRTALPEFVFKGKTVMVLGAGGASKAVIAGLLKEGVACIKLTNRTRERAEAMSEPKVQVVDWDKKEDALKDADILVNTTVLGMDGQKPLIINLENLPKNALVTDIVYKPLETCLLKEARGRGNQTVDGLGMLLYQAAAGFEAWFGVRPQVTEQLRMRVLQV